MISAAQRGLALVETLRQLGISNEKVLQVIQSTPRQLFVDEAFSLKAWENTALPIGQGQTISQPYIVAKMTDLILEVKPKRVLEVGTGSGYQTAVLASLVDQVYSIERIKSLQFQAKRKLKLLDRHNTFSKHGDGWQGWPSKAPFDAIIVTAAAAQVPQALLSQLKDGGRLVIPVGEEQQILKLITRHGEKFLSQQIEAVRFVPLVSGDLL